MQTSVSTHTQRILKEFAFGFYQYARNSKELGVIQMPEGEG